MGGQAAGFTAKHLCGRRSESERGGDPVSLWPNRLGNPTVRAQLLGVEAFGMDAGEAVC